MSDFSFSDKIFVAGHKGLLGSAIVRALKKRGYGHFVLRDRSELDLLNTLAVNDFYEKEKPDIVFLAAARVGGIHANNFFRADFIYENLQIQNNVIWGAHKANVKYLIFMGSSCIYPRECPQPMREDHLLSGPLEPTNQPYALAKIAGLELVNALRRQYQRDYFSVMPTNLYGPGDNFHPENSHVVPGMIRKFHEAKKRNDKVVTLWGSGTPLREFMFSDDCADAITLLALANSQRPEFRERLATYSHINIGSGEEISIRDLAFLVRDVVGFSGDIVFDKTPRDGSMRKLVDSSKLKKMGFTPKVNLEVGLGMAYDWFEASESA